MRISNRFDKHIVAAATVAMSAVAANASVVTWGCNLVIPNSIDGLYINIEAQTYGSVGNLVSGWDINPYGASSNKIQWLPSPYPSPNGYVIGFGQGGTTAAVASLSGGTVVGAASTFDRTASSVTAGGWMLNAANYFGFKFFTADGLVHYGYGVMTTGATLGVRTLTSVSYESVAGVGITVVPAPGALVLLGFAGIASRRRRN